MGLSHEHVGPKILATIKIYILTRAELLCRLCYEIPCITLEPVNSRMEACYSELILVFTVFSRILLVT